MEKKILYINPLHTDVFDIPYQDLLNSAKEPSTVVDVISFKGVGPTHLQYNAYNAMIMPELIKQVQKAEASGYDAAVIGCFYDPGLRACREVADKMAIIGPSEASLHLASTLGENISIIVSERKCIPEMKENVHKYGFIEKLASFESVEIKVHDFQKNHEETKRRIRAAALNAIQNKGSDVIVLGCTAEFGFYEELQEELRVPVIDPGLASFKYAEYLVELRKKFNWAHSKLIGYQSPPAQEMNKWLVFS
ncbi:aspartate/glutamate racemase family protein [Bacillus sp. FJAT-29937]|uniref:aspartate/glutamate racemase family protein n=1 Tax=Bacillus sp. FJAT-29937 TaxID=1720553 RepID=UPI00082F4F4C|nr:aspartate/glutamate racemase family protein [Bacillus sp. FJAT-29937]